jgi:acetoacetyl-CoA reductase
MNLRLDGRRALVTGGTGAIGSAICTRLASMGATVTAVCVPAELVAAQAQASDWQSQGLAIEVAAFDVSDPDATEAAITALADLHGGYDILVNCAGITRDAPLKRMTVAQWQAVLRVNLDSMFNTSRVVADAMAGRGWGRIVNISSVNGQKGQFGQTNYAAAKAGVHGFTMALALEVARKGVTVNTVAPGYVDSPMIRAVPEAIRADILRGIPAGRYGTPADIAAAVAFLCSDEAAYISGAQLPVNGAMYLSA